MRTLNEKSPNSLLGAFSADIAGAMAVRRASQAAKAARAEAEMSIKARAEFLANMNHELRTPLNAIIGFCTMLKESETYQLTDEQRDSYADYILQSADLLLGHINTLLEAAALDGGDLTLDPDEGDAAQALRAGIERAKIIAEASRVTLEEKSDGAPALFWGDQIRTGQAIDHVLRTAIRFAPEGSRVLVRASTDADGWAEIAVRDRGAGMSDADIERALTAFRETHFGLDRSFAGPGVGFAIAKTFIEIQGGRFLIKSKIGEGTLVRISLPPPKQDAAAAPGEMKLAG